MLKTAAGLVDYAKSKLGVPYVYGTKMEKLTQAKFEFLQKTYGKAMVWDADAGKIGKTTCDCSGLISSYTGVVQGSAQMKTAAAGCYPIATVKAAPVGALLWQNGHVGIYIGLENGAPMYIAEDGSAYGCRKNKVANAKFTHWLLMDYMDYAAPIAPPGKEENDVVTKTMVIIDGKTQQVATILKDGFNYVKLRDLAGPHIAVGYNENLNLPTVDTK